MSGVLSKDEETHSLKRRGGALIKKYAPALKGRLYAKKMVVNNPASYVIFLSYLISSEFVESKVDSNPDCISYRYSSEATPSPSPPSSSTSSPPSLLHPTSSPPSFLHPSSSSPFLLHPLSSPPSSVFKISSTGHFSFRAYFGLS